MKFKEIPKLPTGDGLIIVISSISSTATYIFVEKILQHLEHPIETAMLSTGLIIMFILILIFFKR